MWSGVKVLQCGFPKSGNSLLNKILVLCLKERGIYKTFSSQTGWKRFFEIVYEKEGGRELFEGYLETDDIFIEEGSKLYLKKPYPKDDRRGKIEIDFDVFINNTSLVWTHSNVSMLFPFIFNFGLRFYIIRDGRAVVNSLIHFTTMEHVRLFNPSYKIRDPLEVYKRLDIFESYVRRWKQHVLSYMNKKEFFVEIRYEKLIGCGEDFEKILNIFGLLHKKDEWCSEISLKRMKEESPFHVRKGDNTYWKNYFTGKHKNIFKNIAGDLLIELGYEKDNNW